MAIHLDAIDLKILNILQEKGKITNVQLSQEVGLSPAPTLERVKKLENSGVIKSYHAQIDKTRVGLGFTALIQLSLTRQKDNAMRNFVAAINKIPEITECLQLTGSFDYQLRVVVRDIPAFERLIADKLSRIEEIGQMQTVVVLSEVKSGRSLPIRTE
ncbi:MAG: Lrp/AsnC family transcriptional regulator [Flavobacteriales bacterium]|nr:Lrp/AsnC family transcriptional regulator [Flavobacteriales bacterium]HRE97800.1 Lrp/AsnC family transcriptional regulator [Flavobacteriales bacterium]HRJ37139.1 Lrp/AsnC family transcriptional regulator [Flavobacteriales bacterium]